MLVDRSGFLRRIERTDGSIVECDYKNKVLAQVKVSQNGLGRVWKRDAPNIARWRCLDRVEAQLISLRVNEWGEVTYEDMPGTTYTIRGDGNEFRRHFNGSRIWLKRDRDITDVERPDRTTIKCRYNNRVLTEITEKDANGTHVWKRQEDAVWRAGGIDEIRRHWRLSDGGSCAYVSCHGDFVVKICYLDETSRDFQYQDGKLLKILEHTRYGGDSGWQRQGQSGNWNCGQNVQERQRVAVSPDGDYSYETGGVKYIFRFDDSEERLRPKCSSDKKGLFADYRLGAHEKRAHP